jgi:hypothetical protein
MTERARFMASEFRKEWGQFDEIDPHLYEVAHVMDSGESHAVHVT